jgi:hypothetical protein
MGSAISSEATKPLYGLPSEPEGSPFDGEEDEPDDVPAPAMRPGSGLAERANGSPPIASASSVAKPERGSGTRSGSSDLEPTEQDLQISARLLLHIARQPRYVPMETLPESLTQAGMAKALGRSQASVSNALNRLVDGGALEVHHSHIRRHLQRMKVYQLTAHGELLVRQIRESMVR